MCGIFGYVGKEGQVADMVLEGLKTLEYRGYDSWGVAIKQPKGGVYVEKHVGKIGDAKIPSILSTMGIGHTRWATHGGATELNAHPHKDCTGNVIVVHNGIIENFLSLKNELMKKGHTFVSETDTEVSAHLIEEELRDSSSPEVAVQKAFKQLEGRNAIIVFFPQNDVIVVVKNGTPLSIGKTEDAFFLASDAAALIPHTRSIFFMEDNTLITLDVKHTIHLVDLKNGADLSPQFQTLDWNVETVSKGKYPYFLLKEIMDQGETVYQASLQNEDQLKTFVELMRSSRGTYIVGCGTAAHACRAATYIFSIVAKRHVNFAIGSEFSYLEYFLTPESLLIAVSQSGETADILEAVEAARKYKSRVASLVNVIGSTLNRESDISLPLKAGPEKSVLSSKAFTAKLAIFYLLAYTISGQEKEGKEQLIRTADAVKALLGSEKLFEQIKRIAKQIHTSSDIYLLGRGLSYPIALEGAHKIKEASYIHAEGFAGGEPKHCEISLVSRGTPTIIFVPNDETKLAILSNAMEYKARGAHIIGISPTKHDVFDEWIEVPDVGVTHPIVNVIPTQILAYYLALEKGNDPDKPRNLAKSVTVK